MFQKLNSWLKIETIAFWKVISIGVLLAIFFANCKGGKKEPSEVRSNESVTVTEEDPVPTDTSMINWLDLEDEPRWDTVAFTSAPDDTAKIEIEKESIRSYLRGALAEYNAVKAFIPGSPNPNAKYEVMRFYFTRKSSSPLKFSVVAFLNPPATRSGHGDRGALGHVIPPPPPPPPGR